MKYMRANATHFKSFVVVHPGGGTRRSERITKRKNPGALSKSSQSKEPTTEEVEAAFQQHLKAMEQGGAYGDNMEIIAFANSYAVNVCIYSEEMSNFLYVKCDDDSGKVARTAYIVHHVSASSDENLAELTYTAGLGTLLLYPKCFGTPHRPSECCLCPSFS